MYWCKVATAMAEVMDPSYESVHIGCFELTGLLITLTANDEHDSKIKPQGMERGTLCVPKKVL